MNAAISLRNLTVLMACQLLGSACAPSTEQLIKEAHDTGDWSQVEKRQDAVLERQARMTPLCEDGLVSVCKERGKLIKPKCVCVDTITVRRPVLRFESQKDRHPL